MATPASPLLLLRAFRRWALDAATRRAAELNLPARLRQDLDHTGRAAPARSRLAMRSLCDQLGLPSLSAGEAGTIAVALDVGGRRSQFQNGASLAYAVAGWSVLGREEAVGLTDAFGAEALEFAWSEPLRNMPAPTAAVDVAQLRIVGRYAAQTALSRNPAVGAWITALDPCPTPNVPNRDRLLAVIDAATATYAPELAR